MCTFRRVGGDGGDFDLGDLKTRCLQKFDSMSFSLIFFIVKLFYLYVSHIICENYILEKIHNGRG